MIDETLVDAGGRQTRVVRGGRGPALVWLHDSLGNHWTAAHAALSASHEILAPSLPGFEDSSTLGGIDGPEDVVLWLVDLLNALQLRAPSVIGCGLGGWMAAELAVRYPERLERLVLVDAYGLRVEGALPADEFALTPSMLRPLVFAQGQEELALQLMPDVHPRETIEPALHARVAAARLAWQFPYDRKLRARLSRASMPALVVWGERDQLVSAAHGRAYTDGLLNARLETIRDAGHYPYVESTDAFVRAVEAFLTQR